MQQANADYIAAVERASKSAIDPLFPTLINFMAQETCTPKYLRY